MENTHSFRITARRIDLLSRSILASTVIVENGIIQSIEPAKESDCTSLILPGFIDAHVHVESSLLIPSEFARMAVVHGSVGTISDPHEIANVLGVFGVEYMLQNAAKVPFHFFFGAPSCVPATVFETAGDAIDPEGVEYLLKRPDIWYLAEVMNYPGVLNGDPDMLAKIDAAKRCGKPIDGHAPGLRGDEAMHYASAGISTDHECFTLDEALDKIKAGMFIQIREGSAARNFEALHPLLGSHPEKVMLCSDDKHPDNLLEGHINIQVKRALALGYNLFDVLRAASWNVKQHYKLPVGMLQIGDAADFIEIDSIEHFNILGTWIQGEKVAENGKTNIHHHQEVPENRFHSRTVNTDEIYLQAQEGHLRVIEALEGQLITRELHLPARCNAEANVISQPDQDILKIVVVNRYKNAPPAVSFIKNLGLKKGAIASTVAHDSHNIIAAGCSDEEIVRAINLLMISQGGLCALDQDEEHVLALPVAGLMSNDDGWEVARRYIHLDTFVKEKLGSPLRAPFMTLSFMALLVIPQLKLSDKGLFDGSTFRFTSNWAD
jgi:adenine deaminase